MLALPPGRKGFYGEHDDLYQPQDVETQKIHLY